MKCFRVLSVINGVILSCNVAAATLVAPTTGTADHTSSAVPNAHHPVRLNFIPDGLTEEGKAIIATAADIGYSNNGTIRAIDYGTAHTGHMGSHPIEATISLHQFLHEMYSEKIPQALWQFIEIAPTIGFNELTCVQYKQLA